MNKEYRKVKTEIGYLSDKRDTMHLIDLEQKADDCIMIGDIAGSLLENRRDIWYGYMLKIEGVKSYKKVDIESKIALELYKKIESVLTEVIDIENDNPKTKTIIVQTYDWVFIIECKDYRFDIIAERPML